MPEPTSSIGVAVATAAGVTVFGIATGLQPETLLPGLAGAWWMMSRKDEPAPFWSRRLPGVIFATLAAGWLTPLLTGWALSMPWWPARVSAFVVQFPIALCAGIVCYERAVPALLKVFGASADKAAKS